MLNSDLFDFDENISFKSLKKEYSCFNEVFEEILRFIKQDAGASYRISIGTDSQTGNRTLFVSCIHVHRIGKGAIGFLHKFDTQRRIKSIREKIYMETCLSLQLAYLFNEDRINSIYNTIGTRQAKKYVTFEFHIDIGTKGETKTLINEMVGMVKGINFTPKIKPDSYCASCFADRYTKAI